jgi:NAD(P)-dependent dehydrogenase (short-subunit alcohol dehydrogenase family)
MDGRPGCPAGLLTLIEFRDQVAIVTGAGKGLGRSYAEALACRGAAVLVNNRRHPGESLGSADEVVAAIREAGGAGAASYEAVDQPGAGKRIVDTALAAFGRLDLVVANAGISDPVAFHKEPIDHVRRLLDVNLFGAIELVHAALPILREQRFGRIVVMTSSAALYGDAGFVSYAAAKAGLVGFVAALAHEALRVGVTINAILPFAHTPMTRGLFEAGHFPAEAAEALGVGPVTSLALWLLSRDCDRTGQVWVAGGRVFRRAVMGLSPGIVMDGDVSPERVAARAAEIAAPGTPSIYVSGAEMLEDIARVSLGWNQGNAPRDGKSVA